MSIGGNRAIASLPLLFASVIAVPKFDRQGDERRAVYGFQAIMKLIRQPATRLVAVGLSGFCFFSSESCALFVERPFREH